MRSTSSGCGRSDRSPGATCPCSGRCFRSSPSGARWPCSPVAPGTVSHSVRTSRWRWGSTWSARASSCSPPSPCSAVRPPRPPRADHVRRARRTPPGAAALRSRLPVDPGLCRGPDPRGPAGCRHPRSRGAGQRRAPGRRRPRRPRCPGVHRAGQIPQPGEAVSTQTLSPPPQPPPVGTRAADVRRARRRLGLLVTTGLGLLALALLVLTMMVGSYGLTPWEVVASLAHQSQDPATDFIVRGLRLPVAATGLAAGIALGVSGAIFQKLLNNPLASPDFVGVSSGASLAAIATLEALNASRVAISGSALIGALVSATLVYVLAFRGGLSGYRFILVGIGVSELMLSLVGYIVARAELFEARQAMTWLVGSVGQAGPGQLWALIVALVVLLPVAILLERPLRSLELGDDTARALGTRVELHRLAP